MQTTAGARESRCRRAVETIPHGTYHENLLRRQHPADRRNLRSEMSENSAYTVRIRKCNHLYSPQSCLALTHVEDVTHAIAPIDLALKHRTDDASAALFACRQSRSIVH